MIKLFKLGLMFLKNSRTLTVSAFISIFMACFLGVTMFQLSSNIEASIVNSVMSECEDYKTMYPDISEEEIKLLIEKENEEFLQTIDFVFNSLYIVTLLICGLFIVTIFNEFLKKYINDMAIIRTVGGKSGQVDIIFCSMLLTISFFACISSGIISAVFDGFAINYLNNNYNFFKGSFAMNWYLFFLMIIITFVVINAIVMIIFVVSQDVAPVQIFHKTSSGLKRRHKGNRLLFLRRIVGTQGYIGFKLIMPKLKQNLMLIFLIALMCGLIYIINGIMPVLVNNSYSYFANLVKGADACVYFDDTYGAVNIYKTDEIIENMKEHNLKYSYYLGSFGTKTDNIRSFSVTDTDNFAKRFVTDIYGNMSDVPINKRMIISRKISDANGYRLGDTVPLKSDFLKEETQFIVVGITDWDWMYDTLDGEQVWIDKCNLMPDVYDEDEYYGVGFFVEGENEHIRDVLRDIKMEQYDFYSECIYDEAVKELNEQIKQINSLINIVTCCLMIVIGVGWLNSIRGILISRKKEYKILRMLGASAGKVRVICLIQVFSYMFTGIIIGTIGGYAAICYMFNKAGEALSEVNHIVVNVHIIIAIAVYFLLLSLSLRKTIRDVVTIHGTATPYSHSSP